MTNNKFANTIIKYWTIIFRHTRKNSHLSFYIKGALRYITPKCLLRSMLRRRLLAFCKLSADEQAYIRKRVDYYCKFSDSITLPDDAPALDRYTYRGRESYVHDYVNSAYFFDAYEYVRYFPTHLRWAYNPGDVNYLFPLPEITKSRPIVPDGGDRNNILLNLDKARHFTWVHDPYRWEEKECRILFRGDATNKPRRQRFIEMWKAHPWCDLISTGKMSLYDHLKVRYIMALEGNDVASNLKWVMSSNSAAVMPRPTCETWYMEAQLIPGYHYIEIAEDYHDLIDKITYYEAHPEEAKAIVKHAHEWVKQFRKQKREDLISLMVLDKYFCLTGQWDSTTARSMTYFVNDCVKLNNSQKMNAQGKAREDVMRTCLGMGCRTQDIKNLKYSFGENKRYHHYPWLSDFVSRRQVKAFARTLKCGDTIIIQDFHLKHMQKLSRMARKRGVKVIYIIHDVQCIRFDAKKAAKEVGRLNNASMLLVHTPAMKSKLEELGVKPEMRVMNLFDYYSEDAMLPAGDTAKRKREVVFAGNLMKSEFLKPLTDVAGKQDILWRLYGVKGDMDFSACSNIEYAGFFKPEHTASIAGGWGLIWDGNSLDTCSGELGEYLRYNSSHKTSLYLACGIPVIVWEHSSLAQFVREHNIGITVSSLNGIANALDSLSDEEYMQMIVNARSIGEKLRCGGFLTDAIGNALSSK